MTCAYPFGGAVYASTGHGRQSATCRSTTPGGNGLCGRYGDKGRHTRSTERAALFLMLFAPLATPRPPLLLGGISKHLKPRANGKDWNELNALIYGAAQVTVIPGTPKSTATLMLGFKISIQAL